MVGNRLGRYRILSKLGEGGMGEVYLARDERLERDVAVKVLPRAVAADVERLSRFEREVKALARLAHPNILTIHDFGVEAGGGGGATPVAYAVTEFLVGQTLRDRLEDGALSPARAADIAVGIAEGLAAAHDEGIVHRDVKPENLFLTASGRVKILDFGIAKLTESGPGDEATISTRAVSTGVGAIVGTVGYMAPEQLRGLAVDSRADIFAFGCVLYEMLSGRPAFRRDTTADTMSAVLMEQPPRLDRLRDDAVAPALQRILDRCLEKSRHDRYQSAHELAVALAGLQSAAGRWPAVEVRAEPRPSAAPLPTPVSDLGKRPSIAVLPFLDLAAARDQEYFCDGLAEELTSRLTHLRGLRVVSRTSAFAFKGRASDAREIGRQLNVATLLEGSVQRAGDRVRVRVQLTDASDGCQAWSERFDRPAGDIFAIEDEIAQAVVSVLKVKLLGGGGEERAVRGRGTTPAAHDLYLQGRFHAARRGPADLDRALACFEQAVVLDPEYAPAHAGIAECQCVSGFIGFRRPHEVFPLGRAAAERALEIDPDLVDAHAVLGHEAGMYEWQWAKAEHHFRRALELGPGHALTRTWYSHLLTASGRFDEAIAHVERACDCDPLAPTVHMTLGLAHYYAGDYPRAINRYLKSLEIHPSFALARFHLGRTYYLLGDVDAAVEQYEQAIPALPIAMGCLIALLREVGRHERAEALLADLEAFARTRYTGAMVFSFAYLGDRAKRLGWLTRSFDEHEGNLPLLNTEPMFERARDDPEVQALVDRMGLPRVERRAG